MMLLPGIVCTAALMVFGALNSSQWNSWFCGHGRCNCTYADTDTTRSYTLTDTDTDTTRSYTFADTVADTTRSYTFTVTIPDPECCCGRRAS
eukprot:1232369-Amphidinium_carterae.1